METSSAALAMQGVFSASPRRFLRRADTLSGGEVHVAGEEPAYAEPREIVVHMIDDSTPWLEPVAKRLEEVGSLLPGWDGYGSTLIDAEVVEEALALLGVLMSDQTVPPAIVPTHVGSVILEWHRGPTSFDIEILPTRRGIAYFRDRDTGEEWEDDLGRVRERARGILRNLADLG